MSLNISLARTPMGGSMLARHAQDPDHFANPFKWQVNPLAELAESTGVTDWAMRRVGERRLPASSLRGMGDDSYRYTGLGAGRNSRWQVNPLAALADPTGVTNWAMRRVGERRLPASSLQGIRAGRYRYTGLDDYRYTGLDGRNSRWQVNPLAGPGVTDWAMRRVGERRLPASSLRAIESDLMGFSSLGSLDSSAPVRDVQVSARKLGVCMVAGGDGVVRPLAVDGRFGPQTRNAMALMLAVVPGTTGDLVFDPTTATNSQTVRVNGNWWRTVQEKATGHVDSCASSGSQAGSGGGRSPAPPSPDAPADPGSAGGTVMASLRSPWGMALGALALAAVGYWGWTQYQESQDPYASAGY